MPYTPEEIQNIQNLARHADMENVLLAFELIKGQGLVPALETDIYWIYNRVVWDARGEENENCIEILAFLRAYWGMPPDLKLQVIVNKPPGYVQTINPLVEQQIIDLGLNFELLTSFLYPLHEKDGNHSFNKFFFKYGSRSIQEKVIRRFFKRHHTGCELLDLGDFKLGTLPEVVLRQKYYVQMLDIWGNDLKVLPDFLGEFESLEVLNVAENQLSSLPKSITKLHKLQRLYAKGNHFDVDVFIKTIQQLPNIKFISVASDSKNQQTYSPSENTALKQFEELVNQGKMHTSEKTRQLIMALYLDDEQAFEQLSLMDLFSALSDTSEETRKRAKVKILQWKNATYNGFLHKGASVAILGLVSFATRGKVADYQRQGIFFSSDIQSDTTHLVIGDFPENYEEIQNRKFIFLSEEDI